MTKKELIEKLTDPHQLIKDDAVILAWDPETRHLVPLGGLIITSGEPGTVELCTDNPCD